MGLGPRIQQMFSATHRSMTGWSWLAALWRTKRLIPQ